MTIEDLDDDTRDKIIEHIEKALSILRTEEDLLRVDWTTHRDVVPNRKFHDSRGFIVEGEGFSLNVNSVTESLTIEWAKGSCAGRR